jgi:hypothetical protein
MESIDSILLTFICEIILFKLCLLLGGHQSTEIYRYSELAGFIDKLTLL